MWNQAAAEIVLLIRTYAFFNLITFVTDNFLSSSEILQEPQWKQLFDRGHFKSKYGETG